MTDLLADALEAVFFDKKVVNGRPHFTLQHRRDGDRLRRHPERTLDRDEKPWNEILRLPDPAGRHPLSPGVFPNLLDRGVVALDSRCRRLQFREDFRPLLINPRALRRVVAGR